MLVDAPARAERQRHAHQYLVAIEFGWWRPQRIPCAQPFQFMRWENVSKALGSQFLGISAHFCAVSVPLKPGR
jgi:hypothetical protein